MEIAELNHNSIKLIPNIRNDNSQCTPPNSIQGMIKYRSTASEEEQAMAAN